MTRQRCRVAPSAPGLGVPEPGSEAEVLAPPQGSCPQPVATLSVKGQTVTISCSEGHTVFVTTGHLCQCQAKAATDNPHGSVPIKLLTNTGAAPALTPLQAREPAHN